MLNVDNDTPVVHSLSAGRIAEMVFDKNKHEDSGDEDDNIMNTCEKMLIDDMVKLSSVNWWHGTTYIYQCPRDYGSLFNQR